MINISEPLNIRGPLLDDGKISCKIEKNDIYNIMIRVETGEYQGVKYSFDYSEGEATIQGRKLGNLEDIDSLPRDSKDDHWSAGCAVDPVDNSHFCYVARGELLLGMLHDGTLAVSLPGPPPGSKLLIRVDSNEAISLEKGYFSHDLSHRVIEQLKRGQTIAIRQNGDEDFFYALFGFSQAWSIMHKIRTSIGAQ